jgi:AraC-like DNA-binding protein
MPSPGVVSGINTGVCVERMTFTAGCKAQLTRGLLADGIDDVLLLVHETGRRIVSQLGREATLEPGGGLLVSNADVDTHVVPEPCSFVSLALPRKLMMTLAPGLEDAFVRPLPPNSDVLRLLTRYLDLLDDEHALETQALRAAAATHIHDLCALAIGAARDVADVALRRGVRAARLCAIKADIAQNLAVGDLSPAALARRQRISPRYIHKLFESEGTTLSRYVLGLRLARVHRLLVDPRRSDRMISTLAFEAGFGDLSYFNREFRRRYGATPSDVRAMAGT